MRTRGKAGMDCTGKRGDIGSTIKGLGITLYGKGGSGKSLRKNAFNVDGNGDKALFD